MSELAGAVGSLWRVDLPGGRARSAATRGLLALLTLALALVVALAPRPASPAQPSPVAKESALAAYERLPLSFVPNAGQTDERVRYLARGAGYSLFFTDDRVTLSLRPGADENRGLALDLRFIGANPAARLEPGHKAAGTVNLLTGQGAASQSGVPTYGELVYRELWPGIDMAFRGQAGSLKYEFHLRPGADPRDIRLAYAGANGLSLGSGGTLAVHTSLGDLKDARPVSYQRVSGRRVPVETRYALDRGRRAGYGFALGAAYDSTRPLVIDPSLEYSTFLGGADTDLGQAIAVDEDGHAYITGEAESADYPTTRGAFDRSYNDVGDAFVTKLSRSGSRVEYSTFVGGTDTDFGRGIAVDEDGHAYITGQTFSDDYPTTRGAFDRTRDGFAGDAFVTKLSRSGSRLEYSTYLGGPESDFGIGIAVDEHDRAYVTGDTSSPAFPTTRHAYQPDLNGISDAFVTKLGRSGSWLEYSTFLGGGGTDFGLGIAVDERERAYVTGGGDSPDYPTTEGAFDTEQNGTFDAVATKLSRSGSALEYSTFLGGADFDLGVAIAVDDDGRAHVSGQTASADYPSTPGAYDTTYNDGSDAFATKLSRSGSALDYSTFLGGANSDLARAIAVDEDGKAYVAGETDSSDYPTTPDAYDTTHNGFSDAFVTKLNRSGSVLTDSTFLGGTDSDAAIGIAVDEKGRAYATGQTFSADYPTTARAFDTSHNGDSDAFVTKLRTSKGHHDHHHDHEDDD